MSNPDWVDIAQLHVLTRAENKADLIKSQTCPSIDIIRESEERPSLPIPFGLLYSITVVKEK